MLKMPRIINITLLFAMAAIFKATPLSAEYTFIPYSLPTNSQFQYANAHLWGFLRLGLNYLESPSPLSPPEAVPPTYAHPDSRGYGAYGFSPEAYQDVQRLYPFLKDYSWQDILHSQELYELANQAFADWLLKNLQNYIPSNASQEQVFDVLHKAWNVGLSGFKAGRQVLLSRTRRAEEFKTTWLPRMESNHDSQIQNLKSYQLDDRANGY